MIKMKEIKNDGLFFAIIAFLSWGLLPVYWVKLNFLNPFEILAHRIVWSFFFLFIFQLIKNRKDLVPKYRELKSHITPSVLLALNWLIYIYGVSGKNVIEVSLGYYLAPIFQCFAGILIFKEKHKLEERIGIALAIIGVGMYCLKLSKIPVVAISIALTFVLYGISKKKTSTTPVKALYHESMILFPVSCIYLFLSSESLVDNFSKINIAYGTLTITSGIITIYPLIWFSIGAKKLKLSTLGFCQYIGPTTNLIIALVLFKEDFSQSHLTTFIFIWLGVLSYSSSFWKKLILSKKVVKKAYA